MGKNRVWIMMGCCGLALAAFAWGQTKQKAGLWELTTQMNMSGAGAPQAPQMPQLPPGVQLPPGMQMPQMASPFAPHTSRMCVTQAMIDKYGGPYSNPPRGDCQVTDIAIALDGMTAKLVCTGQLNATGTVKATWTDSNSTKMITHLTGTMQSGQNSTPLDMTMQSTWAYKGPECGDVKPIAMPAGK